ncbi:MAG: gamma-glutamylcyclotransferase family protein [Verrucomicrobiota bacterium]|nr:gamma-glutamylcyclotransferase family protein [Verrucomicrobiota bacterium]
MPDGNLIYFAYGSNMCPEQMTERCPGGQAIGPAALHNWQFLINIRTYATIEAKLQSTTHGVLWTLTKKHIANLDEYEAVEEEMYYKKKLKVFRKGKPIEALVYIDPICEKGLPDKIYIKNILNGAKFFNLPKDYISQLENEWGG